jgi:hypothetical protein
MMIKALNPQKYKSINTRAHTEEGAIGCSVSEYDRRVSR